MLELWEDGRLVGTREPTEQLSTRAGTSADRASVRIVRNLGATARGPALVASWAGREAFVAWPATDQSGRGVPRPTRRRLHAVLRLVPAHTVT